MENLQFSGHSSHADKKVYLSSLLIDEIENENIDKVKWLLQCKNADPNLVLPAKGVSPMHVLAGFDNERFSVEVIEIALTERGGDPNIRSEDGLTPVHIAAIWGRSLVLEILLKFGGDPFLLDYKCSLNAEDLALKEHQWKTHAILATFSVFNDKHEQIGLDDYLYTSTGSSICKTSSEYVEWPNNGLSEMTQAYETGIHNQCIINSIPKTIKSQDKLINCNMSFGETNFQRKDIYQVLEPEPSSFCEGSSNLFGKMSFEEKNTKEQDKLRRKKKLSSQFAESFTKLKNFFGRASFPKLSSGNTPKVDFKRKTSKSSI